MGKNNIIVEDACDWIINRVVYLTGEGGNSSRQRLLLGITGPPGSGKSTIASAVLAGLPEKLADSAVLVPMDGFHLSDPILHEIGLHSLKGIPESFDAEGFCNLVGAIRRTGNQSHSFPVLDRNKEASIADAGVVEPGHKIVLVEGNYLLLDSSPWHRLRYYFDEVYYLDVPDDVLESRLLARHMEAGKDLHAALQKVESTDMPNVRLVRMSAHASSFVLTSSIV